MIVSPLWLIAAILATFAIFALWPGIDLWLAAQFYTPGQGFVIDGQAAPEALRRLIWGLSIVVLLITLICLPVTAWRKGPIMGVPQRIWLFSLLLYALGPGLLVDGLLKRFWGRARPAHIVEFGGSAQFTPPHQISDQCLKNCSFVAGEMSGAVALAVVLLVILYLWRNRLSAGLFRVAQGGVIALPMLAGAQRIAAGRHFLSDVILATLFVLLLARILWKLLPERR